jgi:phage-related holin
VTRIFEHPLLKLFAAVTLVMLRFLFDSLNQSALVAVFVLILMDTLTGILAAYRRGELIQSHKILRTAIKLAVYFVLISAGFVAEKAIPVPVIDETIIAALAFTELLSILENTARAGFTIAAVLVEKLKKNIPQ